MSTGTTGNQPGAIVRRSSDVEEYGMRQLALQHAVATHGETVDENQVVTAARAYLAFLTNSPDDTAAG